MLAAVTEAVGTVKVKERDEPAAPGPGEVLLAPAAVGICGSDYHLFLGEISAEAGGGQFPRVFGHEIGARVVALGPDVRDGLTPGQLVSVWPLIGCGECYPCSVGRVNVCANFNLIGVHRDGGLQQRLLVPDDHVFPISTDRPAVAALAEPLSVAVQAAHRGRLAAGERAVIFGGGPIGQCIALVAREYGASALVVDLQESRLEIARSLGAEALLWTDPAETVAAVREWAGDDGPPVGFDATGAPTAVAAMITALSHAGRAVQVGMSSQDVTFRLGLLTEKELDVLGVCCCDGEVFGEAVRIAERHPDALASLISHEYPLAQFPEALRFAIDNPKEVVKVVILGE